VHLVALATRREIVMSTGEGALIRGTLRSFRRQRIEADWDALNAPDAGLTLGLWRELQQLGVTTLGLPETAGGLALDAESRFDILHELGAGAPALAFALVSHVTALALLHEAGGGRLPAPLDAAAIQDRFALVGSPLDRTPEASFRLVTNGHPSLSGSQRVGLPYPDWLVVPALDAERLRLCVLRANEEGVAFAGRPSSHGLRLIPFGELVADRAAVRPEDVFPWPASGRPANEADGLVAAALAGMTSELADRAMAYAHERYQGGKMIQEHDAVQEMTGPIELSRRCLRAVALQTLAHDGAGDGGASAFAVERVRQSALDAIQTFGGYGYMEDYRVERYLRDANTLETCWIHAAARQREIARARFAAMVA
jgi:alkylation response protein AidB-like acyl-CoA dehydrogenase